MTSNFLLNGFYHFFNIIVSIGKTIFLTRVEELNFVGTPHHTHKSYAQYVWLFTVRVVVCKYGHVYIYICK